jgi:hypothetical protein
METPWLEAVRRSMSSRGVPRAYIARLVTELSEHREDLIAELVDEGTSPDVAGTDADRRLGDPDVVAAEAIARRRAGSLVGRHRVLCLVVLPVLALPILWTLVLFVVVLACGLLSPSYRMGELSENGRALLSAACWVCGHVLPAGCGAAFFLLARERCCGAAWARVPVWVIAAVASFVFLKVFAHDGGGPVGRLVVSAAPWPDPLKLILPPLVLFVLEALQRARSKGLSRFEPCA